ncbi:hypothetical protein BDQ12DRAFT_33860 [Crucibulum laeve]|uniref:DUF1168 domain protein n=1 Tax=Crucibulum laeve TaxID=68775 RepID=A0A5C3MJA5_9AGAR|nr:hypothetical protein BDQ12DRAFT_33860 [Crucibulum laeve]
MSTSTTSTSTPPVNRHVLTAVEKQRTQLEKLLKDPAKPAYVPSAPKEKTIRPAREMMKNVQGSSAGAGSGEFHVYKASRRREYERLKLLEEESQKETITAEFERKRREAEELAEAKTAKNRAKRQKKKERSKTKGSHNDDGRGSQEDDGEGSSRTDAPIKKRRLVNGKELIFKRPGEVSDDEDEAGSDLQPGPSEPRKDEADAPEAPAIIDTQRIIIHEDD